MAAPTGDDVAGFLGRDDESDLVALAEAQLPFVTATVDAYTRSQGFTAGVPDDDVEQVIVSACARLVTNPELVTSETIGDYRVNRTALLGFTLPELAILNRHRKRAA